MKYFTFTEFERSETAVRYAIDNTLPEKNKANVATLVDTVLDPLREAWGKPITVTSGYRCPALNAAVGGVSTSLHQIGRAADITTGNSVGLEYVSLPFGYSNFYAVIINFLVLIYRPLVCLWYCIRYTAFHNCILNSLFKL